MPYRNIEVWIYTNEKANSEPLEHYWDVEVKLNPKNNIVFECSSKESAIELKQCIENNAKSIDFN